jgi:hypothetical protein
VEADAAFRRWVMHTWLELVNANWPSPDNELSHCMVVGAAINRCVSLGRYADALTLSEWMAEAYVPRGDDLSQKTILESSRFYSDAGHVPELNERVITLLRRVIELAPRDGDLAMEWAICTALMDLGALYTVGRNVDNNGWRTRASIGVYDEIIERWLGSRDDWLRFNVVGAMVNKSISYMEIGEESEARREYARIVDSFAEDAGNVRMVQRVSVARHALDILDTVRIPEPEFKTEYLAAMRRRAERTGLWLEDVTPRDYVDQLVDLAGRMHQATANLVRRHACSGEPIVLLLRNFELMETSVVTNSPPDWMNPEGEPETYVQVISYPGGLGLVNRLSELADVVQVANTQAAGLEIDSQGMSMLGRQPTRLRMLYLPDAGWADVVRVLISLAERIVVWAGEKTPGVLRELELITELGRVEDTTVLLDQVPRPPGMRDVLGPPGETLLADDPVLARFPVVLRAEDIARDDSDDNPLLRAVIDPVIAVWQLPMEERMARVRHRIDAARRR